MPQLDFSDTPETLEVFTSAPFRATDPHELDPLLTAVGGDVWAVLGPDGEFVADLDAPPTSDQLFAHARLGALQRVLAATWDGAGTLTVRLADDTTVTTLTAHQLLGARAVAAQVLAAGQDGYGIENPHCLAHRHDPDVLRFAADLFDNSSEFAENVVYLDHVAEVLEGSWPLSAAQRHVVTELADQWTGDVDELIATAMTVAADKVTTPA